MVNPSGPHLSGGCATEVRAVCRANIGADGLSQLRSCVAAAVLPRPYCPSALGSAAQPAEPSDPNPPEPTSDHTPQFGHVPRNGALAGWLQPTGL
ncbi:unnamed protein product [Gadus morhua 'NCC']